MGVVGGARDKNLFEVLIPKSLSIPPFFYADMLFLGKSLWRWGVGWSRQNLVSLHVPQDCKVEIQFEHFILNGISLPS